MTRHLVIIGCGGFGREVFSIVEALRANGAAWQVAGFVDDAPSRSDSKRVQELGSAVLGPISHLTDRGNLSAVIAVGSARARVNIVEQLSSVPICWSTLVHPNSTVGLNVELGAGSVVAAGARLSTNITVGRHVQVDQNVTVGHDTRIGDFARLNPQACVSGSVVIGDGAMIGANATVLQGLHLGAGAVVGAGACVVKDVLGATTVKGVPAR